MVYEIGLGNSQITNAATGTTVLLVDGNRLSQRVVESQLERLGCSVTAVDGTAEALKALSASHPYRLIILSWSPPGRSMVELAQAIRERFGSESELVRIVGVSPGPFLTDDRALLQAVMDDILVSPIDIKVLREALEPWFVLPAVAFEAITGPPAAAESPCSHPLLHNLSQITAGDIELALELIDFCRGETPELVDAIRAAMEREDAQAFVRSAWSLATHCGYMGVYSVAQLCAELARHGQTGITVECTTLYKLLELEYRAAMLALEVAGNRLMLESCW